VPRKRCRRQRTSGFVAAEVQNLQELFAPILALDTPPASLSLPLPLPLPPDGLNPNLRHSDKAHFAGRGTASGKETSGKVPESIPPDGG
jgi:hypothetical protein